MPPIRRTPAGIGSNRETTTRVTVTNPRPPPPDRGAWAVLNIDGASLRVYGESRTGRSDAIRNAWPNVYFSPDLPPRERVRVMSPNGPAEIVGFRPSKPRARTAPPPTRGGPVAPPPRADLPRVRAVRIPPELFNAYELREWGKLNAELLSWFKSLHTRSEIRELQKLGLFREDDSDFIVRTPAARERDRQRRNDLSMVEFERNLEANGSLNRPAVTREQLEEARTAARLRREFPVWGPRELSDDELKLYHWNKERENRLLYDPDFRGRYPR